MQYREMGIPVPKGVTLERVVDRMRRHYVAVHAEQTFREVEALMRAGRLRHVPVIDGELLAGVISHRDLMVDSLGRLEREVPEAALQLLLARSVAPLVSREPQAIGPQASLADAAALMRAFGIGCLPVVEGGALGRRLLGLITEADLLAAAYRQSR
jgi:acetoin utilization protein AcuB